MECSWIFGHKWSKWKDGEMGKLIRHIDGIDREVGGYLIQMRECLDCGEKQLREVRT